MPAAPLTPDETARLARVCQWLELSGPSPLEPAQFRAFLVAKLCGQDTALAARVAGLTDDQMEKLIAGLRDRQALARQLVFG